MSEKKYSDLLAAARRAETEGQEKISAEERPGFHLTPAAGWMNDPNGFSYYGGEYHLFYQYNPYATHWDTMHWGHAVSSDLLKWTYRPAVLAPDMPYDEGGCYSGSAVTLEDGRQLLLYTGLEPDPKDKSSDCIQTQSVAVGDGTDYVKYEKNPVIDTEALPEGLNPRHFRDPKIIRLKDGTYGALAVSRDEQGLGHVLLYKSRDGFSWKFCREFCRNDGRFGRMWECPDFFELDGKWFLMVSPMEMRRERYEYHNGFGNIIMGGRYDEDTYDFTPDYDQNLDYGIDFYAAQTILSPDGRRIMIGWMQNWATIGMWGNHLPWAGQMTLPRELSFHDGRLYQQPVRELSAYYGSEVFYRKVPVTDEISLYGVDGRMIDLDVSVSPAQDEPLYRYFVIRFAMDADCHTEAMYSPDTGIFSINRENAGSRAAIIHQQSCMVPESMDGNLSVRIILDRYSFEIFINDGRYVMSAVIFTNLCAEQISFRAGGKAVIDVSKREIKL